MEQLKELSLRLNRKNSLGNLEIDDRGARFIAYNLKNLTYLDICKQFNNLAHNYIEDSGATEIANGLKNLTYLNICKQLKNSA
jgi:hypothetical protein